MSDDSPTSPVDPGQAPGGQASDERANHPNGDARVGAGDRSEDSSDGAEAPGDGSDDRAGESTRLSVPQMDCPSCAGKVEGSLSDLDGIEVVDPRPTTGTVEVSYDPDSVGDDDLVGAIEGAGYEVVDALAEDDEDDHDHVPQAEGSVWTSTRAWKTWISGVILALGLVVEFALSGSNPQVATVLSREFVLSDVLLLAAAAVGGQEILRGGYYSARNLNLDIDFLMSAAILSAVTASLLSPDARLYSEAATLAVLFSLAELLESYAMDRARTSMRELIELAPDDARVRRDGETVTVPADEVQVGDVVLVQPGEKIPADGTVIEGESAVDESPITGESVPADKAPGDEVYAGTLAEEGYLEVEVTAAGGDDTLSRIIDQVENAQSSKTERERFVDRFAGYYTPLMVGIAILVAAVPPLLLGANWVTWFVAGITMLVLACPCAFVISTPVSVVSGITSAARNGVLIKGGKHLEAMGAVEAVAVDKTGTLTKGELAVTDVVALNGNTEDDVLRCARGVERRSEHPIAEAVVGAASAELGPGAAGDRREIANFESLTGKGVRASLGGMTHFAGKPGLFEDLGFDLSHAHVVTEELDGGATSSEVRDVCDRNGCLDLAEDTIPRLQREGKTVVLVGTEDELEGIIAVADELRPGADRTVARLQDLGVEVVMLTGDNHGTARAIAEQVGIDDFRAGLLPDEKVDAVEELLAEYDGVAMVGDGVNDAPALATATVGVAMGAAGTDTAIETADVALLGDDLGNLPYLYELAHRANGVIRENIWASLAAKAVLAVGVPLGYVTVAIAVLVGDAGMTLGVTGNAMRLARIRPEEFGDSAESEA